MNGTRMVFDACSALNLYATGRAVEILKVQQITAVMTPRARGEATYLKGPPDSRGKATKIPVDLKVWSHAHVLVEQKVDVGFDDDLVRCSARLKDADAECLAVASVLRLPLISDDSKIRKVCEDLYGSGKVLSSLQVVRTGVELLDLDSVEIGTLLRSLRDAGNFFPGRNEPELDWFNRLVSAFPAKSA